MSDAATASSAFLVPPKDEPFRGDLCVGLSNIG